MTASAYKFRGSSLLEGVENLHIMDRDQNGTSQNASGVTIAKPTLLEGDVAEDQADPDCGSPDTISQGNAAEEIAQINNVVVKRTDDQRSMKLKLDTADDVTSAVADTITHKTSNILFSFRTELMVLAIHLEINIYHELIDLKDLVREICLGLRATNITA